MRYVVIFSTPHMQEMGQDVVNEFDTKAEALAYAKAEGEKNCRIIEKERG